MLPIYIMLYLIVVIVFMFDLYLVIKFIEYVYCGAIRHQPPLVSSPKKLRKQVVCEIALNYPDAKNICELGSGFGGLARMIACKTNANVYALENMPFAVFISKACDFLLQCKNNKTIYCDAFNWLEDTGVHFDIAIAYLGPNVTPKIKKYRKKIDVLISLDFEIPELAPKRVIKLKHGYTKYKKIKYPHRIFVYEFK